MHVDHLARFAAIAVAGLTLNACGTLSRLNDKYGDGLTSFVARDVRVFDGERVIEHADVVVRAGRVTRVGHRVLAFDLPVVDGAGRMLVSGTVDAPAGGAAPVTLGPGDAYRLVDSGRITRGTRADLLLVEGNPLAQAATPEAIVRVFRDGYDIPLVRNAVPAPQPR